MKYVIFIIMFFATGCAIVICDQKSCYQEITKQDFVNLIQHRPTSTVSVEVYYYAGSDNEYDYIYSFIPNVFPGHDSNYHYYKLKVGVLNLPVQSAGIWEPPARVNFSISKKNRFLITNNLTETQVQKKLEELLKEPTSQP